MKKIMLSLLVAIIAIPLSFVLTACSNDDTLAESQTWYIERMIVGGQGGEEGGQVVTGEDLGSFTNARLVLTTLPDGRNHINIRIGTQFAVAHVNPSAAHIGTNPANTITYMNYHHHLYTGAVGGPRLNLMNAFSNLGIDDTAPAGQVNNQSAYQRGNLVRLSTMEGAFQLSFTIDGTLHRLQFLQAS